MGIQLAWGPHTVIMAQPLLQSCSNWCSSSSKNLVKRKTLENGCLNSCNLDNVSYRLLEKVVGDPREMIARRFVLSVENAAIPFEVQLAMACAGLVHIF